MKKLILSVTVVLLFSTNSIYAQSISIKNAWARPAAQGANSALYFIIENNGNKADTLIGAESSLADIVEMHETYKIDNDKMGMRPVDFVAVAPNSKEEFKPGGFHIMLLDMQRDFKIGELFEAALQFKHAGKIKIKAKIQDSPGKHTMMMH